MKVSPARMLAAAVLVTVVTGSPAAAQDAETEAPQDETTDDTGSGSFSVDLGDRVSVEPDGTVVWNVETDTDVAAEEPTGSSATGGGDGIEGTGSIETPSDGGDTEPAGADAEESPTDAEPATELDGTNAAGTGNGLAAIAAIGAIAIAIVVGTVFVLRTRRSRDTDLEIVEDVITGGDHEMHTRANAAYAGATDAGAYEEGGAAYAQYAGMEYGAGAAIVEEVSDTGRFTQLREQMVDLADKGLADTGQARMIAKKLEAAGSKMRPGEWLLMTIAGTIAAFAGVTFLLGVYLGLFAGALTVGGFWMALEVMTSRRQKAFAEDLPETLQLIAGSLRGGLSMMQAIQTVADEADDPTCAEFQRVITETRLGRDLAQSFRDLSSRMGSHDFEWVVTAIEIHREVGGDLASILDRVGGTIRQRNRVRGQVKALSAEGRVSGLILFLLPIVMLGLISVMNREYLNEMLNEEDGQIMLVGAGVLLVIGGVWLRRLARFVY